MQDNTISPHLQNKTSLKDWLAVVAAAIGIFSVVSAEQLPIGLLTQISSAMGISEGFTGLLVIVPGIIAAIAAPLLPVAEGNNGANTFSRWINDPNDRL